MRDPRIVNSVRDVLLNQSDIELACAFGSVAGGKHPPESDVDVAVASRASLSPQRRLALNDEIACVISVHAYHALDWEIVFAIATEQLGDFVEYGRAIEAALTSDSSWES